MQYAMSVSLGGKYVFATVMCLVLPMCMFMSYVVLDQCNECPSLFVLSVCAYGGVWGIFGV